MSISVNLNMFHFSFTVVSEYFLSCPAVWCHVTRLVSSVSFTSSRHIATVAL